MNTLIWVQWIILVLLILIALAAIPAYRIKQEEFKRTGKHPRGFYKGKGMAYWIVIWMAIWLTMDNIAIGVGIWVAIWAIIWAKLEKQHESELRPLTQREENLNKWRIIWSMVLLIIWISVFFFVKTVKQDAQSQISIISSFEECINAWNPAMESYPRQCRDKSSWKTFTEVLK